MAQSNEAKLPSKLEELQGYVKKLEEERANLEKEARFLVSRKSSAQGTQGSLMFNSIQEESKLKELVDNTIKTMDVVISEINKYIEEFENFQKFKGPSQEEILDSDDPLKELAISRKSQTKSQANAEGVYNRAKVYYQAHSERLDYQTEWLKTQCDNAKKKIDEISDQCIGNPNARKTNSILQKISSKLSDISDYFNKLTQGVKRKVKRKFGPGGQSDDAR